MVAPHGDPETRFVDKLIKEATLAARLYLGCTCGLLILALVAFLVSLKTPSLAPEKMIAAVISVFGAIPVPLFLNSRSQRVALAFLKDRWEDACARNDALMIERIRTKVEALLEKGLGLGLK